METDEKNNKSKVENKEKKVVTKSKNENKKMVAKSAEINEKKESVKTKKRPETVKKETPNTKSKKVSKKKKNIENDGKTFKKAKIKKHKLRKVILWIVLILILITTLCIVRKMIIFSTLSSRIKGYLNATNYHERIISTTDKGVNVVDYYVKDNKEKLEFSKVEDNYINKMHAYKYEDSSNIYTEYNGEKSLRIDSGLSLEINMIDEFGAFSLPQLMFYSATVTVRSVKCNDKDCYYIKGYTKNSDGIFIEKATGLVLRREYTNFSSNINYEYNFNCVTDNIFDEPDRSEYAIN